MKTENERPILCLPISKETFVPALLDFFRQHARSLPWRKTGDPYKIWISEVMLQQTRVETVIPYYERFLSKLPDLVHLAEVDEDRLLKLWEGLGYYSRARNLKKTAKEILATGRMTMPASYRDLVALHGIGPYTAGAIASIAYGEPVPAVDGNVLRVVARLTGYGFNILEPSFKKAVEAFLRPFIPDDGTAGTFNQALIELGALVCTPGTGSRCGAPKCEQCPLSAYCASFRDGTAQVLPVRINPSKRTEQKKTVLLLQYGDMICLRKRSDAGLLAGLFEFPTLDGWYEGEEIAEVLREAGLSPLGKEPLPPAKHVFTHMDWLMKGWRIKLADSIVLPAAPTGQDLFAVPVKSLEQYALPSAFSAYRKLL